jgi:dual-specificity kinase
MEGSYYKWLPKSNAIKVIDFGSTIYGRLDQSYLVSIRHYRAPEVILGICLIQWKFSKFSLISVTFYDCMDLLFRAWMELPMWYLECWLYSYWALHGTYRASFWFAMHHKYRGSELAHLPMMERVFGPLPCHMLKRAGYVHVFDSYQGV